MENDTSFEKKHYICSEHKICYTMNQVTVLSILVLAIVIVIVAFSYLHKRHVEYKMVDIEKAVRSAYPDGTSSVSKDVLVKAVKKYFHCSSKEAHYIIGVARRKKLVDIAADKITLHSCSA